MTKRRVIIDGVGPDPIRLSVMMVRSVSLPHLIFRAPALVAVCLGIGLSADSAGAYCTARSCVPDFSPMACELDDDGICSIEGVEITRLDGCITFGVEAGGADSLGLTDQEFAEIVNAGIQRWAEVDCGDGRGPSIDVAYVGPVEASEPFACAELGANLDVWMVSRLMAVGPNATGATAALTTTEFIAESGDQLDSDVEFNLDWLETVSDDELRGVLLTVATHEAGHALGLAHSGDPTALMFREYDVTPERELTADDVAGICSLFPPDEDLACGEASYRAAALSEAACDELLFDDAEGAGCTISTAARSRSTAHWIWAGLLVGALRRWRNRRI